jgi:hypothetical protein
MGSVRKRNLPKKIAILFFLCILFQITWIRKLTADELEVKQRVEFGNRNISFVFECPAELRMLEIGRDAYEFSTADQSFIVVFTIFPVDGTPLSELRIRGKVIYMASSSPPEETVLRTVFGRIVEGEKQRSQVPFESDIEVYVSPIPETNYHLFVGFRMTAGFGKKKSNSYIQRIMTTLEKEL